MRRIARTGSAGARTVGVVLAMAIHLWLARALGPVGYGSFILALVVNGAVVLVANVGIGSAVAYRIARDPVRARSLLLAGTVTVLASSLLAVAVLTPVLLSAADPFPAVTRGWLAFALAVVPIRLVQEVFAGAAVGVGRWERSVGLSLASPVFLASALVVAFGDQPLSEATVAVAWLLSQAATLVAAIIGSLGVLPRSALSPRDAAASLRSIFSLGTQQTVNMAAWWLTVRTDRWIVGTVAGPGAAGRFAIGASLVDIVLSIPSVIAVAVFRQLVREAPQRAALTLQTVNRGTSAITAAVLGLAVPPLATVGADLLGPAYGELPAVVVALIPGAIALVPTTLIGSYFLAVLGRPSLSLVPTGAALAVMILVVPYLTGLWGVVGAAIGTSLSQMTAGAVAVGLFSAISATHWQGTVIPKFSDGLGVLRMLSRIDAFSP